jgi:hypothetical protein
MDRLYPEINGALTEQGIRLILIGGYAMQAYGIVRQTLDMDWLAKDEDVAGIKDIMKKNGYNLLGETDNFMRFRNPESGVMDIDILIVDPGTFEMLYDSGSTFDTNFGKWRIPSPAHFIALKLHAVKNNPHRETRDIADIVDVLRKKGKEISSEDLRRLCDKYGPEGIHEKIRRHLP